MKPGFRITKVWVFVAIDGDDEEGVCAFMMPNGMWMPMVAADEARLEDLMAEAQHIANHSGKTIRLVRLDTRSEVKVIEPAAREGAS